MRVYGYDSCDIMRGEVQGAEVDKLDLDYPEQLKARLDWEEVSTSFNEAKGKLLAAMAEEAVDAETIAATQQIKRSHILF